MEKLLSNDGKCNIISQLYLKEYQTRIYKSDNLWKPILTYEVIFRDLNDFLI